MLRAVLDLSCPIPEVVEGIVPSLAVSTTEIYIRHICEPGDGHLGTWHSLSLD